MTRKHLTWSQKLRHYWIVLPLLFIMLLLAASELDNMGYNLWERKTCDLQEISQGGFSGELYAPITRWALRITPSPSVAIIYIDPKTEPAEILTNTCASRVFLSRLIQDLNTLRANVIVIDKFYSEANCAEKPKNKIFVDTMDASVVPVVVGQPTQALDDTSNGGCLALSPKLEFDKKANVHYGLTRLNSDSLKLPLRWPIFQPATKPKDTPTQLSEDTGVGDSIALVAATQQDPNLQKDASIEKLLSIHVHPYTTFVDLPHINAMAVLCSAEAVPRDAYGQPFGAACNGMVHPINDLDGKNLRLNGKIVVIGDKATDSDMQPFPGGEKPGVWLQANYIQSLLDRRFLHEVPLVITLVCLLLFIFVAYCLFWYIDQPERALLAGLALVIGLIIVSLGILITTSYFTPLWALWGAGLLVIFRYLETQAHHLSDHLKPQHTHLKK
jgi:CHASE2 domain-containing sensor protein